jgi:hypothetical protein
MIKEIKKFNHTRLWALLCSSKQGTSESLDVDAALDEFAIELHSYCRQEKNLAERTRTLRYAHSELVAAREQFHTGAEKKCTVASNCFPSFCAN